MMERALKERITGAAILVIFVVLVVPIFLDGPPEEGETVSESVLLPGQEQQDTKTVVLERGRSEPIPTVSRDDTTTEVSEEKPTARDEPAEPREDVAAVAEVVADEAPTPPATSPTPAATSSTTGMWAVQLGSFSNKDNAETLAADLRKQGYAAFLSQLQTDSGPLHRVRIGPQKDREGAEAMAARLAKVDHQGQVVPHP